MVKTPESCNCLPVAGDGTRLRVRSSRGTISGVGLVSALLLSLCWAQPGSAQTVVKVGSFLKSTGGAPASQTVPHGLGQTPKALILWTDGKTDENFSASFQYAFGMTDGTTSKSVAIASQNAVRTSNTSRRLADKALTIVQWDTVAILAEADRTSWDATTFTLNWTTNDARPPTSCTSSRSGAAPSRPRSCRGR